MGTPYIEVNTALGPPYLKVDAPRGPLYLEMEVRLMRRWGRRTLRWNRGLGMPYIEVDAPLGSPYIEVDAPLGTLYLTVDAPLVTPYVELNAALGPLYFKVEVTWTLRQCRRTSRRTNASTSERNRRWIRRHTNKIQYEQNKVKTRDGIIQNLGKELEKHEKDKLHLAHLEASAQARAVNL